MELIITVWVPWSGKTTLYQSYKDYMYVGFDDIMDELYTKHLLKNVWRNDSETKDEMNRRTIEYLIQWKNVYYDDTNYKSDDRKKIIKEMRKIKDVRIKCIYFKLPLEEIKKRNKNREWELEERIIERYYNETEEVTIEEWRDEIKVLSL